MVSQNSINKPYIEKRIDEWIERLDCLYNQIDNWIKSLSNYKSERHKTIQIQEELMIKYRVKPKEVPCYLIFFQQKKLASFIPNALWVIGADGRINLTVNEKQYILIDLRNDPEHIGPSKWNLITPNLRQVHIPFTEKTFLDLIVKDIHAKKH